VEFMVTFTEPYQLRNSTVVRDGAGAWEWVAAGTYRMRRVPNPTVADATPWLVLAGVPHLGATESSLRQWEDGAGQSDPWVLVREA
jgi:hypothetical protein